jgi:hypothetical protein
VLFGQPDGTYHVVCLAGSGGTVAHLLSWDPAQPRNGCRVARIARGEDSAGAVAALRRAIEGEVEEAISRRIPWTKEATGSAKGLMVEGSRLVFCETSDSRHSWHDLFKS